MEFTGMMDKNFNDIYLGQSIDLFGMKGNVVFECCAYGIGFEKCIDYELLQRRLVIVVGIL